MKKLKSKVKVTSKNFELLLLKSLQQALLHAEGKIKLRETILISKAPQFTAKEIIGLRKKLNLSQTVFAMSLNVSPRTVASWEKGSSKPKGSANRLLQIIDINPKFFIQQIS